MVRGWLVERNREALMRVEQELDSWRYLLDYFANSPEEVEGQNMLLAAC